MRDIGCSHSWDASTQGGANIQKRPNKPYKPSEPWTAWRIFFYKPNSPDSDTKSDDMCLLSNIYMYTPTPLRMGLIDCTGMLSRCRSPFAKSPHRRKRGDCAQHSDYNSDLIFNYIFSLRRALESLAPTKKNHSVFDGTRSIYYVCLVPIWCWEKLTDPKRDIFLKLRRPCPNLENGITLFPHFVAMLLLGLRETVTCALPGKF